MQWDDVFMYQSVECRFNEVFQLVKTFGLSNKTIGTDSFKCVDQVLFKLNTTGK